MQSWIFQGNPKKSDILGFLQKGDYWIKKNGYWATKQNRDLMQIGDIVYFWKSGKKAGIYGITHLVSKCEFIPKQKFGDYYVKIHIDKYLGSNFIPRQKFKENPVFRNSYCIRFNQWTNYLLTDEEAKEINKIIRDSI